MALGGVIWMKGLFGLPQHRWLFFVGLAGVLFTMIAWWRDVVQEANQGDHTPVVSIGLRYGMILFIASEVMFFVAWFWIFFETPVPSDRTCPIEEFDRLGLAAARRRDRPAFQLPLVNTLTLLLSGTTVTWAHHALQTGDRKGPNRPGPDHRARRDVHLVQAYEYSHAPSSASRSGIYGSSFFMATGFHGFHVLIGTIFLTVCLIRLLARRLHPAEALRLRGGRLVLALRRRGLAVPVRVDLLVGSLMGA